MIDRYAGALRPDPLRRRARPPVDQGGVQALREGRAHRQRPLRRQCLRRPRRLGRRSCSTSTTPSSSPPARRTTARSASPASDLPGVIGSAAFVGWYNGHPDFADLDPPLDVAARGGDRQRQCRARRRPHPLQDAGRVRRLGHRRPRASRRSASRRSGPITVLGRRGPHQIAMTPKELGELGHLEDAVPAGRPRRFPAARPTTPARARPAQVGHPSARLREPARRTSPRRSSSISSPGRSAIEGDGQVERLIVEKTGLDDKGGARRHRRDLRSLRPRRQLHRLQDPADRGVPYEERGGRFANADGVIGDRPLLRRLGAARADRHDRHQPARRL